MTRTISFKEPDKNKELFETLLNEIRVYAKTSGHNFINDNLSVAHDYLYKMELLNRIPDSELFLDKLRQYGFTDTDSIIQYTLSKSNIIGWQ